MVGGGPEPLHFTVRDNRWRYTLSSTGEEELYDHQADPHEWRNLANQPGLSDTKTRLHKHLRRLARQEVNPAVKPKGQLQVDLGGGEKE